MKLYNENQLNNAIDLAKRNVSKEAIIEYLEPIELPSEEDIDYASSIETNNMPSEMVGFIIGANWLKEQILKTK